MTDNAARTLWCLVEGEYALFRVTVPLDGYIADLQKTIKQEKEDKFKYTDANELRLFQVCHLPASVQLIAQQSDRSTLISRAIRISQPRIVKSC